MVDVYSKALNKTISISRIIAKINSQRNGPTVVFFGGIHGNETAAVFALNQVFQNIVPKKVNGNIYAVAGNLTALKTRERFIHADLNRIWTKDQLNSLRTKTVLTQEELEQFELYRFLEVLFTENLGPFYFIDLHTTSSKTFPFITINDALINRNFSKQFPVPIVLGIEEYLEGPLLSYINSLGYVSIGFEAGQHDDVESITNSIAFINLALGATGSVKKENIENFDLYYEQLNRDTKHLDDVFEITYLYRIVKGENFQMLPDFSSFQEVDKGTLLAISDGKEIASPLSARLFMPFYQKRGNEGFFIIKRIAPFFMKLSAFLRRWRLDSLLVVLPGISWDDKEQGVLKVNLKVTRFYAKQFFHLFGYRNKQIDETHLRLFNRERVSKTKAYKDLFWFKNN